MLNRQIFKNSLKASYKLWLIITFVALFLLILMVATIVNKGNADHIKLAIVMGFFKSIAFELPLIFIIVIGNKIVAGEVERGHMAYLLSSSLSRKKLILSKMNFFILAITLYALLIALFGGVLFSIFKTEYTVQSWLFSCVGFWLLLMATSSIAFLSSVYFNKSAFSISVTSAVVIFFFISGFLSDYVDSLSFLKYLSMNSLFDASNIDASKIKTWLGQFIVLITISSVLFTSANIIFTRKDLPL